MRIFAQRSIDQFFGGNEVVTRPESGVRVSHDSALSDDAVLSAVSLLAGDIASLPMRAFETAPGGLTQALDRQPSWIDAPDPLDLAITDVAHKTQVALSVLLAGESFTLCEPSVFDPVKLTVLNPVRVRVTKPNNERLFTILGRSSPFEDWSPGDTETLSSAQILHVPYMLRPGRLHGLSPIDAQAGNLGISLAMRKWLETFFGKGGMVSGFVSLPTDAASDAADEVSERINKKYGGWRKAGILGVLSGGASWVRTGLTLQDANMDALWRRQIEMAARVYGIPPFMIGSQEPAGVAYASSVERAQHYISHCLNRYTGPIEKAYSRLVPGDSRLRVPGSNTEVRFIFDAFLRGDPKARWETYLIRLQAKAAIIDEIRALDNLAPMGDYTQEQLEGPGGLLQTPNNNARQFPAGDQGPVPPGDAMPPPMELMPGGKAA
jgi:HK97 family phage portal protein